MERRELGQRAQITLHGGVEEHRLREPLSSVDDPMSHHVAAVKACGQRTSKLSLVHTGPWRLQLLFCERFVLTADQAQLETAGSGVYDKDSHLTRLS
jgi:hypothetical protein